MHSAIVISYDGIVSFAIELLSADHCKDVLLDAAAVNDILSGAGKVNGARLDIIIVLVGYILASSGSPFMVKWGELTLLQTKMADLA